MQNRPFISAGAERTLPVISVLASLAALALVWCGGARPHSRGGDDDGVSATRVRVMRRRLANSRTHFKCRDTWTPICAGGRASEAADEVSVARPNEIMARRRALRRRRFTPTEELSLYDEEYDLYFAVRPREHGRWSPASHATVTPPARRINAQAPTRR